MMGAIRSFYGSSVFQSFHNQEPVIYWNAPHIHRCTIKVIVSRGFLWDDGFHNLLISKWNTEIFTRDDKVNVARVMKL